MSARPHLTHDDLARPPLCAAALCQCGECPKSDGAVSRGGITRARARPPTPRPAAARPLAETSSPTLLASPRARARSPPPFPPYSAPPQPSPLPAPSAAAAPSSAPKTLSEVDDATLLHLLLAGSLSPHTLEATLGDPFRAVELRRAFTAGALARLPAASRTATAPDAAIARIPLGGLDAPAFYASVLNTNCEAVIGFIPYPLGVVGPLPVDGREYRIPLATTEGALIASTNRGCAAIRRAGGATTALVADGMTRAPLLRFPSLREAAAFVNWVNMPQNSARVAAAFATTTRYGRLVELTPTLAGRSVYLRFKCSTGDAMGMNMITKGVSESLAFLKCADGGVARHGARLGGGRVCAAQPSPPSPSPTSLFQIRVSGAATSRALW